MATKSDVQLCNELIEMYTAHAERALEELNVEEFYGNLNLLDLAQRALKLALADEERVALANDLDTEDWEARFESRRNGKRSVRAKRKSDRHNDDGTPRERREQRRARRDLFDLYN